MKTFVLLATICLLGVASAAPATTGLEKDLLDFIDLLPKDKLLALAVKYQNDKEIQETGRYLFTDEFAKVWVDLSANKDFQELIYFLNDTGLSVLNFLNEYARALGLPLFPRRPHLFKRSVEHTGGWKGYYEEFEAILPKEEIKALFNEKMETSKEYAKVYHQISSPEFERILKTVKDSQELTSLFDEMLAHGLNINDSCDLMARMFGWKQ